MVPKVGSFRNSLTNILKEVFPVCDPVYRNIIKNGATVQNPLYKSVSTGEMQKEYKVQKQAVDKFIKSKMP